MIIRKIVIKNFLCYFGTKTFEFENGLNVILGDNGEGKTKFFEAIYWLFNGGKNFASMVSAKALKETNTDDKFDVSVLMEVEQYASIKSIQRSFTVLKTEKDYNIANSRIIGVEETKDGERIRMDGEKLLDIVLPPEIRKYSLFKGESELNIFNNKDALNILVNSFSSAKHYDKYLAQGASLKKKAEAAVDKESRHNSKKQTQYKNLENEIVRLHKGREKIQELLNISESERQTLEMHIEESERYVDNAESLETINNRIKDINSKIRQEESVIKENYTTYLFDDNWILTNFENVHRTFAEKIKKLQSDRRKLQSDFDREEGIKAGKEKLKKEIIEGLTPLPVGVPAKAYMEEMLDAEYCTVCNRPAKKGTPSYNYIQKRLKEYLDSLTPKIKEQQEKKVLFKHDYTRMLFKLSSTHEDTLATLREKKSEIKEIFEFNATRKEAIKKLKERLQLEIKDREKIIGSSSIGENKLANILKNYSSWQRDINSTNNNLRNLESDLKQISKELEAKIKQKEEIDIDAASSFLIETRNILRNIEVIFRDTKEVKYDEFITQLEKKSNLMFQKINADDFTGKIVFKKRNIGGKSNITIELQENGKIFYSPNQSLVTSMHMGILFAISELASELKEESFPMIFDAPTSSFGETKTKDFLNLVYQTGKQRIILFYDFISKENDVQSIKPEFEEVKRHKAFWLKRQRPFDKNDLSTINTEISSI